MNAKSTTAEKISQYLCLYRKIICADFSFRNMLKSRLLFQKNANFTVNYNLGHNILELYNVLIQIRLTTSKTKHDI